MSTKPATQRIKAWPQESREAAQLVIDKYGEPDEASDSQMLWHNRGRWKRIIASKAYFHHEFPAPHSDCVQCVIDYRVPVDKFTALAQFDGSVVVERTAGEVSARCHDEEANNLALNLMHDLRQPTKKLRILILGCCRIRIWRRPNGKARIRRDDCRE